MTGLECLVFTGFNYGIVFSSLMQTCLLLRIRRIFYVFYSTNTLYGLTLKNYGFWYIIVTFCFLKSISFSCQYCGYLDSNLDHLDACMITSFSGTEARMFKQYGRKTPSARWWKRNGWIIKSGKKRLTLRSIKLYTKIYGNVLDRLQKGKIMCIVQLAMLISCVHT